MLSILRACVLTPTPWGYGIPTLVTGPPGRGKTSGAECLGQEFSCDIEVLSPGEQGDAYFGAVPAVRDGIVEYPPPSWAMRLKSGILVIDELRAAPMHLRPALLSLILARRVGGYKLGGDVSVIALSNSVLDSPAGAPLDPAQANRFLHLAYQPSDVNEWLDVLKSQVCDGTPIVGKPVRTLEEARAHVKSQWALPAACAYRAVAQTLKLTPQFRYTKPEDPTKGDAPWASERTWTLAALAAASASVHGLSLHERDLMIAGCVGDQAAAAMAAHLVRSDLPDPAELIAGKATWTPTGKPDVDIAVIQAVGESANATNAHSVCTLLVGWSKVCREACRQHLARIALDPTLKSSITDVALAKAVRDIVLG